MPIPTVWRSEYQINTTQFATVESDSYLAPLADGRFAMAWTSNDTVAVDADVRFTLRKANGDAVSTDFDDEILAGNGTVNEFRGAVAGLSDNRIVFVWDEDPGTGERDVYGQVLNASGSILTSRFEVTTPSGNVLNDDDAQTVLGLSSGDFMVAYRDLSFATDAIRVRRSDISGAMLGANTVNSVAATDSTNNRPQMAELGNGNVVITWLSGAFGFGQQRFGIRTADGASVKIETDVNPEDAANEIVGGDVITLANGNFVIVFTRQGDPNDVQGRLFDQDGNALTARFDIGSGAGLNPAATALNDGRFMVVYGDGSDVYGRVMFADGTPDGTAFLVSNGSPGIQTDPAIATLADGRVVVSWHSNELGTNDIFAEIYDPREAGLNAGASSFGDDWHGTTLADRIYGAAGQDALNGGAGNDTLYGEADSDTLNGDAGGDKLYGGNSGDTLNGGSEDDTLNGELGDDTLNGDAGSDTLNGGENNDTLNGGSEADILNGNNGNDTLNGEAGQDVIKGGNGDDTIDGGADKDTLDGDADNDTLIGGDTGDTLRGGTGNDRQTGGLGGDVHLGGSGLDTFVFTDDTEGNDRIDDWLAVDDQIEIDASAFGSGLAAGALAANRLVVGAAPVANQAFGQFLYNTANGQLSWDSDGTGATAAVAITRLLNGGVAVATLAVGDFDIVA